MAKENKQAEVVSEKGTEPKVVSSTIKLNCSKVSWIPGDKYDTCVCDLDGDTKQEINDEFETVVKAYLKDRAGLHKFELSGSTEESFEGFIVNFSPYRVSLIRYK